jgi:ribosome-associated translation inhibitor RaiA
MILNYKNSLDALMTILYLGGKITQASNHLSHMLNGVKYYSLEVTINGDHYLIQAFEQEATDLFNAVMSILDEKKTVMKKVEKFSDHQFIIFLVNIIFFLG